MSALGPLLLSLGRFLPSHWAGFSQGKTGLVGSGRLTCCTHTGFRAVTTPLTQMITHCLVLTQLDVTLS